MKKTFPWDKFYSREILAPEADLLCKWRNCYSPGEDKGTFSPGYGYTNYHKDPIPVCMTRMCHGCPSGPISSDKTAMRPEPEWGLILSSLKEKSRNGTKREREKAIDELLSVSNWMVLYLNAYRDR